MLTSLANDLLRLAVWLALLVAVLATAERLWPVRRQPFFRPALGVDLVYYFLSGFAPRLLLMLPLGLLAALLHRSVPSGYYDWVAGTPPTLRFGAALLVAEIGSYWGHRWSHQLPPLWRFHAVHHSAPRVDWLVNTRAHPLDMAFVRLCGLVPMYALGLAQPQAGRLDFTPVLVGLVATAWGFFIHANLRWRFGWLEQLVSTPAFHHWHHSNDGPSTRDKNYAAMLPWVDRLFGTYHLPAGRWPAAYGSHRPVAPGLLAQLVDPLRWRAGTRRVDR